MMKDLRANFWFGQGASGFFAGFSVKSPVSSETEAQKPTILKATTHVVFELF
jgi:hypothetical protein